MNTRFRCVLCLGLLLTGGCDEPIEEMDAPAEGVDPGGKADGLGGDARVRWNTLASSGCSASAVVNDPSGNAYASTWLFQEPSVVRCSLSGSATFPAGVVVQRMVVSGEGYIAGEAGATPSVVVDVRGSSDQVILEGSALRKAEGGEGNVLLVGTQTLSAGCLAAPRTFRFRTDFAVGAGTHAQFDSLDVQFDVEACGG